jgi:hypothetical protein
LCGAALRTQYTTTDPAETGGPPALEQTPHGEGGEHVGIGLRGFEYRQRQDEKQEQGRHTSGTWIPAQQAVAVSKARAALFRSLPSPIGFAVDECSNDVERDYWRGVMARDGPTFVSE